MSTNNSFGAVLETAVGGALILAITAGVAYGAYKLSSPVGKAWDNVFHGYDKTKALQDAVAADNQAVKCFQVKTDGMLSTMNAQGQSITNLQGQTDGMQTNLFAQGKSIDKLQKKVDAQGHVIGMEMNSISKNTKDITNLQSQLGGVTNTFAVVEGQITTVSGIATTAQDTADQAKAEIGTFPTNRARVYPLHSPATYRTQELSATTVAGKVTAIDNEQNAKGIDEGAARFWYRAESWFGYGPLVKERAASQPAVH